MTIANDAAVAKLRGRFINESGLQGLDDFGKFLDVFDELAVEAGGV